MPERAYAGALLVGVVTAAVLAASNPLLAAASNTVLAAASNTVLAAASNSMHGALHVLNAALVTVLLARLTGRLAASVLAGMLFALHPLRVESFMRHAPPAELLGMTAALLAMLAYRTWATRGGWWRYALAVATYAAAVAATPLVAPVPLLLLLLDAWPLGRLDLAAPVRDPRLVRRLLEKLPFVVLAAVAFVAAPPEVAASAALRDVTSVGATLANACATLVRYAGLTVVPIDLTPLRPPTAPPWWAPGAVMGIAAATAGVLAARTRAPAIAVGWLWFVVALLPVLGVPPTDRFTYLASCGLLVALVGSVGTRNRIAAAAGLAALAAYGVATVRELGYWRDDETLLRRALAVTADNAVAERRLAAVLAARGAWEEASPHAAEAVHLRPDDGEAQNLLGEVRLHEGHGDAAAAHFARAVAADPALARARVNLGRALRRRGKLDEAREHFERALELGAPPRDVLGPLAQTFAETGDLDGAVERYRTLLVLTPDDASVHHRLGTIAVRQGNLELAEREYRTALRLRPDLAEVQLHLGTVLAARGALTEALIAYDAALAMAPRLPSAQYNRALALEATGNPAGARAALRAEIELQPNWPPALLRLAALLAGEAGHGRREALDLLDRAAASLGSDDPDVQEVRRLVEEPPHADSP